MTTNSITAREITNLQRQVVWQLPALKYKVTFDNGEVVKMRLKDVIFNRYIWELFILAPQSVQILPAHSITSFINEDNAYYADTHMRMLEVVFKHIITSLGIKRYSEKEPYLYCIYNIVDYIQNEIVESVADSVSTIDAVDFVDVINRPEIVGIHKALQPNPESIEAAYKAIKTFMVNDKTSNRFVKAYRAKAINENQANQCIGPRGLISDLDRTVYRRPVMNGFIRGMGSLYEMMVESCTAAKSLNASGSHIQTSEYTSRRLQLLSMIVNGVVFGDCGSTEYMRIVVTAQNIECLRGKYYLLQDGTLGVIDGTEVHLHDKIVQIRTTLGCKHHDSTKVCSVCLGEMSGNFEESSNVGYTVTAFLMEKMTQAILSTKHLTHSVRKSFIRLEGLAVKYFYPTENGDLMFHPDLNLTGLQLILPNSKVGKLVDVLSLQHTNIGLSKIGELEEIIIRDMKHKSPISEKFYVSYKDRPSVLTRYLLEYIKGCDMQSDPRGNFVIPLDGIDKSQPIFNNPLKETNIVSFVNRISSIIELNKDKIVDPYQKLDLLFNTTLEKFKCNIFVLEVLIYSTTVYNAPNGNYRLGRGSPVSQTESKFTIFQNRDFSALGAYEKQMTAIKDSPLSVFNPNGKQTHPMSVFFIPQHMVTKT